MAKKQNTILLRWFEGVWNDGLAELMDKLIAPNAIAYGLENHTPPMAMKPASLKHSRNSITAFAVRLRIFTSMSKQWFQQAIWSFAIAKSKHRGTRWKGAGGEPPISNFKNCVRNSLNCEFFAKSNHTWFVQISVYTMYIRRSAK